MTDTFPRIEKQKNTAILIEALVVTAVLAFAAWWIYDHAGGPLLLDELTYMKAAILRTKDISLIYRFFPIYLLMPFIWLTGGDPFTAVKIFWTVLAILTAAFTYTASRMVSRTIIPAIAAVVLYFAQVAIFHYPGVVWPDYTIMLLFSLVMCLYLLLPRLRKRKTLIIGLVGALLYFCIRSKETAIVLAFLFIGYGFLDGEGFHWQPFWKGLLWSLAGMLAGVLFMFFLDLVVMGDAFWAVRGISEYMQLNITAYAERVDYNYLLLLSDGLDTYSLLILYLLSGILLFQDQPLYQRVLFLFPLPFMLIMTAALIHGPAVMEARYLIPIVPVTCVLSTLIFQGQAAETTRDKVVPAAALILTPFIVYLLAFGMVKLLTHFGIDKWDMNNFFMSILYPAAVCALTATWFMARKHSRTAIILSLMCFGFMVYHPLAYNYRYLDTRWAAKDSEYRFYPFRVFEGQLSYSAKMHLFVSTSLPSGNPANLESGMLSTQEAVVATMYSVYFQKDAQPGQFVVGSRDDYLDNYDQYSHALITEGDWNNIPADRRADISGKYEIYRDQAEGLVLIRR